MRFWAFLKADDDFPSWEPFEPSDPDSYRATPFLLTIALGIAALIVLILALWFATAVVTIVQWFAYA